MKGKKIGLASIIMTFLMAFVLSGCNEAQMSGSDGLTTPAIYENLQGTVTARCTEISKDSISSEIWEEMNSYSWDKFQNLKMTYPYPYDFYFSTLDSQEKKDVFTQLSLQVTNDHPYAIIDSAMDLESVMEVAYKWPWSQVALEQYQISQNYGMYYNGNGTYYLEYESYSCNTAAFEKMLAQCVATAAKQDSFYDKEKAIYGWITSNIEYDYDFTAEVLLGNQTAGSVSDGKSVCAGISRFLSLVNKRCGIPSNVVVTKNHAFNYVYYQGTSYLEDATWDLGEDLYRWFLIGQKTRDENDIDCVHTTFDFFVSCPELSYSDFSAEEATMGDSELNDDEQSEEAQPLNGATGESQENEASHANSDAQGTSSEENTGNNDTQDLSGGHKGPETQESSVDQGDTGEASGTQEGLGNQDSDEWSESSGDQGSDGAHDSAGSQENDGTPDVSGSQDEGSQSVKLITSMSVCITCGDCLVGGSPKDALSVSVTYNDGTERILSRDEYDVVGSTAQTGEQPFTVYYLDWYVDIMLEVREAPSVRGVEVTHCPSYYQGDSIFDNTFAVYALYADGTRRLLSRDEYSVTGNTDTIGDTTFFVYYSTWVVEVNVTVMARP